MLYGPRGEGAHADVEWVDVESTERCLEVYVVGRAGVVRVKVCVGLDVGTTGVKAVAIGADGEVVAHAERGYPLSTPRPGWSEQDPEDWWVATQGALADLGELEIAGIGLSGQMHGLVALDDADRVIRPAILWNDQRTAEECAEIEERIGLERLIELTGNRALTGFTAPKLLWLRRHEPEAYARIARIALPKDYVRLRLTGEWATDVADASGTLLLDVANRRWAGEVLEALEIPAAWLPPLLESPEVSGRVSYGNDRSEVLPSLPAPGTAPRRRSASGSTVRGRSRSCSARRGSSSRRYRAIAAEPEARLHAFCHAVPGAWHAMGVMLSAAGSLQWLHDRLAPGRPLRARC